ncbi:MAG: hypothetical protein COV74_08275 [Candidatus Omnitrophica bacterium CG11_big_fil_rev_8_21_14_0_20_45_26]|uniref:Type 4a pilus biogenesis protein PilO n=1 Tax=Candidatus Abzuiibacterium crystallinum TaxID=1974748 RepID=A0A2H0LMB5_9BACT|nr:MAG: hypothetical protein COV74_08275 [Candidatus Omnitrophica bacterium CG11_big_fil_rev_8_21_14_0_20_45_26]PIW63657.1 MAG: hypothetical protein COW12_09160 [Candidatus Omnitrophica bacterium CG12_big_fil_rev_8_21_14_0_65_45_16]
MANQKEFLTEQQKKVVVPVLAGAVLLGALGFIVYQTQAELISVKRDVSLVRQKIKLVQTLQVKQKEEKDVLKSFPPAEKRNDVIKDIANMARLEGLQVDEIDPKESELPGTNFINLALGIRGAGNYLSMARFIKRLEAGDNFILISSLNLNGFDLKSRTGSRRSKSSDSLLDDHRDFDIIINVFLVKP